MLTTPTVTFETDPGRGVLWRAWQGPRACSLRGGTRGGVQRRMRRGPRALWCRGGDSEAVYEWLRSIMFHSVGLSVFVAAASRRRVLHGGDPLGAVVSASFRSLPTLGHAEVFDDYKRVECGWVQSYCRLCCRL